MVCGIVWGLADVLMTALGNHPECTLAMLFDASTSRFAIGFLAATVTHGIHSIVAAALVGLLISLPDAFSLTAYMGILETGLLFGASQDGSQTPGILRRIRNESNTAYLAG